jgi:hypothetical protein
VGNRPPVPGWIKVRRAPLALGIPLNRDNQKLQGAVIRRTTGFPLRYFEPNWEYMATYADRLQVYNPERFKAACDIAGGDANWPTFVRRVDNTELRAWAQVVFGLVKPPKHVRIITEIRDGYFITCVVALARKSHTGDAPERTSDGGAGTCETATGC